MNGWKVGIKTTGEAPEGFINSWIQLIILENKDERGSQDILCYDSSVPGPGLELGLSITKPHTPPSPF